MCHLQGSMWLCSELGWEVAPSPWHHIMLQHLALVWHPAGQTSARCRRWAELGRKGMGRWELTSCFRDRAVHAVLKQVFEQQPEAVALRTGFFPLWLPGGHQCKQGQQAGSRGAGGGFACLRGSAAQLGWHNWCIAWGWEHVGQEPCALVLLQERMKCGDKPEALEMHTHGLWPWLSRNCLWARR